MPNEEPGRNARYPVAATTPGYYCKFIGPPEHLVEEAILWELAFPFKRDGPEGSGLPEKDWWNHLHDFRITYTWEFNIAETTRHGHRMKVRDTDVEYEMPDHLKRQTCTLPIRGPDLDPNVEPWKQDWFAFPLGLPNVRFDGPVDQHRISYVLERFSRQRDNWPNEAEEGYKKRRLELVRSHAEAQYLLFGPSIITSTSPFPLCSTTMRIPHQILDETGPDHEWEEADYMLILQNCIKAPKIPDEIANDSCGVYFELRIRIENQARTRTFFNKKLEPMPDSGIWSSSRTRTTTAWTDRSDYAFEGVHVKRINPMNMLTGERDFRYPMMGHDKVTWAMLSQILNEGGCIRRLARGLRGLSPEGQQYHVKNQAERKNWFYR